MVNKNPTRKFAKGESALLEQRIIKLEKLVTYDPDVIITIEEQLDTTYKEIQRIETDIRHKIFNKEDSIILAWLKTEVGRLLYAKRNR